MMTLLRYLPELCAVVAVTAVLWLAILVWDMLKDICS